MKCTRILRDMAAENNLKMLNKKYFLFSIINSVSNIDALVSIAFGPFRSQVYFSAQGPTSFDSHLRRTMVCHENSFEFLDECVVRTTILIR